MHEGDIVPTAELTPDLALDTDQFETVSFVEGDAGCLWPYNPGEDRVKTMVGGGGQQLAQNRRADAKAVVGLIDVDGVFH